MLLLRTHLHVARVDSLKAFRAVGLWQLLLNTDDLHTVRGEGEGREGGLISLLQMNDVTYSGTSVKGNSE